MKIRWENKYSHETGYVKRLNHREGYFESTFSENEAMEISDRQDIIEKTVALLIQWCGQNDYTLIPTEQPAVAETEEVPEEETSELVIEVVAEDEVKEEEKAEETEEVSAPKDCTPSAESVTEEKKPAPVVSALTRTKKKKRR